MLHKYLCNTTVFESPVALFLLPLEDLIKLNFISDIFFAEIVEVYEQP